jgi:hypothetical protein
LRVRRHATLEIAQGSLLRPVEAVVSLLLLLALPTSAHAASVVLCVKPGGLDGCYASIQAAVEGAVSLGPAGKRGTKPWSIGAVE